MAKTYDTYKDSGIAWIGEIPSKWEVEKVRHLFKQRNSKGNATAVLLSATQLNGMYPQHLLEGVVQVHQDTDIQTFRTVHKNDYVISLRSFQGGFEMSDYEGVCSPAYQVFYNTSNICHHYYKLLFKSQGFISMINSLVVGIREGKNIQYDTFSYSYLPMPPISEQQAIASFLDKKCGEIDSLIALQEEMIGELQAYKQSVITEAVTKGLDPNAKMKDSGVEWIGEVPENWEVKILSKIIWLRARLGWKGLKAEEYVEFGYPFLSAFNIINNQLNWSGLNYINKQRYDESPEIKLSVGDVLIVKDGAGIGKTARVDSLPYGKSTVNSSLGVITPSEILDYQYLYYFLLSNPFQNMVGFLKNGMGVPHLTQENIKSALIPIPPISEQRAIASYLDAKTAQIDSLISLKQEKIDELKDYKKSVIYEYVTGKKRV